MSNTILVGSRKGLFTLTRLSQGQWNISEPAFRGMPVSMVLHDNRDGSRYAALAHGHFGVKLHRSRDGGENWEEIAAPAYPAEEEGVDGPSLDLLWSLETGGTDQPGVLWAGTIPGGLFRSEDGGDSWQLNDSLWNRPERKMWFGGGYDKPGIHSIAVDPRNSQRVTLGVSCGGVWVTEDNGSNWSCLTKGMYAVYMPPDQQETPEVQDPHRLVQCPSQPDQLWVAHHNGVFQSTNGAGLWQDVTTVQPSTFGFAVAVHPNDPKTAWFAPAESDMNRIPVNGAFVLARTRDGGESFEVLREGLPQENAYHLVYRHGLDVDETGECLVVGSTTGGLWISEDGGDSWNAVAPHLPPIYCVRFI